MSASGYRRALAFDFGLKQIGVAVGTETVGTTQPLPILRARDGVPDWSEVNKQICEWQPDLLLVGDPINMDGSVSELARRARKFARRLEGRFQYAVELVDERLTSYAVKQELRDAGHSGDYHRHPVDSYAAELILRLWMSPDQQGRSCQTGSGEASEAEND